jgi:hypothetical protein
MMCLSLLGILSATGCILGIPDGLSAFGRAFHWMEHCARYMVYCPKVFAAKQAGLEKVILPQENSLEARVS